MTGGVATAGRSRGGSAQLGAGGVAADPGSGVAGGDEHMGADTKASTSAGQATVVRAVSGLPWILIASCGAGQRRERA